MVLCTYFLHLLHYEYAALDNDMHTRIKGEILSNLMPFIHLPFLFCM